ILVANGRYIDDIRREHRTESRVGNDELVGGKVAGRQVIRLAGLVVQTAVVLIGVTQREAVLIIETMFETSVVAPIVIGGRDGLGRLGAKVGHEAEFGEGRRRHREAGLFPLALQREEQERLVLLYRPANRSTELLPEKWRLRLVALLGEVVICLKGIATILVEKRAVKNVAAALGNHVHRCAFAAAVGGGEALRGDVELLNGLQRQ